MNHDRNCKIDSRAYRIEQLAYRICKAEYRSAGLQWRRDLRRAISELMAEVDARCDALPAGTTTSQRGQQPEG